MILKEKKIWLHGGLALFSLLFLLVLIHFSVSYYTDHNLCFTVPDLKGLNYTALDKTLPDPSIKIVITDSVYDSKAIPGIVIKQEPYAGEKIKKNRTIYVITTTVKPPTIAMPKLTDLSARQAKIILESYGLKLGSIIEKPADCKGCIIEQIFKSRPIAPGTPIEKGSVIHLVMGTKTQFSSLDTLSGRDSL